jgi:hypothetical protein
LTATLPTYLKPPADMICGIFIRSLIVAGKSTAEILELVHMHFKGNTAKGSDISWNRAKLRATGRKLPGGRGERKAPGKKRAKAKRRRAGGEPTSATRN